MPKTFLIQPRENIVTYTKQTTTLPQASNRPVWWMFLTSKTIAASSKCICQPFQHSGHYDSCLIHKSTIRVWCLRSIKENYCNFESNITFSVFHKILYQITWQKRFSHNRLHHFMTLELGFPQLQSNSSLHLVCGRTTNRPSSFNTTYPPASI